MTVAHDRARTRPGAVSSRHARAMVAPLAARPSRARAFGAAGPAVREPVSQRNLRRRLDQEVGGAAMRPNRRSCASACLALLVASAVAMPARAAFPGTNGLLVFQREAPAGDHTQTDLYTIAPGGAGLLRLTASGNRNEFGPAWNAAGTRIAFWRTPAPFGFGSVWTMNGDGSQPTRLTHGVDARDPA